MSEWSKERDWKSRIGQLIVGSNPTRSAIFFKRMVNASSEELSHASGVRDAVIDHINRGVTIKLPDPDLASLPPIADYALLNVGLEPNQFGGRLGDYRFQFEGEDDLLHLMVCRLDGENISPQEGQAVVSIILPKILPSQFWFKPAQKSQHFYIGHEVLIEA